MNLGDKKWSARPKIHVVKVKKQARYVEIVNGQLNTRSKLKWEEWERYARDVGADLVLVSRGANRRKKPKKDLNIKVSKGFEFSSDQELEKILAEISTETKGRTHE